MSISDAYSNFLEFLRSNKWDYAMHVFKTHPEIAKEGALTALLESNRCPSPEKLHELIKAMINAGASVKGDAGSTTPLHATSNAETIKLLLSLGADPNIQNDEGQTPLHRLLSPETLAAAQALLEGGAKTDLRDKAGNEVIHCASQSSVNDAKVIEMLLKHGANANAKNAAGMTPLHLASEPEIIAALVRNGADVNAPNADGLSPLVFAQIRGREAAASELGERGAKGELSPELAVKLGLIHLQVEIGRVEMVKAMLKIDPKLLNAWHQEKGTPLHIAARTENLEMVEMLVALGADVHAENENLNPPIFCGNRKIRDYLLSKGAVPPVLHGLQRVKQNFDFGRLAVSGKKRYVFSAEDVRDIEARLKTSLPKDFVEFLQTFGVGMLGDFLVIHEPAQWQKLQSIMEDRVSLYDNAEDFSPEQAKNLILLCSADEDSIGFVRNEPERLYRFPRHEDFFQQIGANFKAAIAWLLMNHCDPENPPKLRFTPKAWKARPAK